MKNILIENAWVIYQMAAKYKVDTGVARDMFVGNMEGEKPLYPIDNINWNTFKLDWLILDEETRGKLKTEYDKIKNSVESKLSAAFSANDKEKFEKTIMEATKENERQRDVI